MFEFDQVYAEAANQHLFLTLSVIALLAAAFGAVWVATRWRKATEPVRPVLLPRRAA